MFQHRFRHTHNSNNIIMHLYAALIQNPQRLQEIFRTLQQREVPRKQHPRYIVLLPSLQPSDRHIPKIIPHPKIDDTNLLRIISPLHKRVADVVRIDHQNVRLCTILHHILPDPRIRRNRQRFTPPITIRLQIDFRLCWMKCAMINQHLHSAFLRQIDCPALSSTTTNMKYCTAIFF